MSITIRVSIKSTEKLYWRFALFPKYVNPGQFPAQSFSQSSQEQKSIFVSPPAQTPHKSISASPLHTPLQSCPNSSKLSVNPI